MSWLSRDNQILERQPKFLEGGLHGYLKIFILDEAIDLMAFKVVRAL
jgi:hypothetical protein